MIVFHGVRAPKESSQLLGPCYKGSINGFLTTTRFPSNPQVIRVPGCRMLSLYEETPN